MSDNKLDKPSQLQFAEAITANIPEVDKKALISPGLAAAYVAMRVRKIGRDK